MFMNTIPSWRALSRSMIVRHKYSSSFSNKCKVSVICNKELSQSSISFKILKRDIEIIIHLY